MIEPIAEIWLNMARELDNTFGESDMGALVGAAFGSGRWWVASFAAEAERG